MIEAAVLMLHGANDPHPGQLIRVSLAPHVRHLEYHKWHESGHYIRGSSGVCGTTSSSA